jgi:hypothetical protein
MANFFDQFDGPSSGGRGGDNASRAMSFFQSKGLSPEDSAALVWNFQQESGRGLNPTLSHDGGTGFGIAGFRDPSPGQGRWTNLRNFAAQRGLDENNLDTQLEFAWGELQGPEKAALGRIRAAGTPEQKAAAAISYFRPRADYAAERASRSGEVRGLLPQGAMAFNGEQPNSGFDIRVRPVGSAPNASPAKPGAENFFDQFDEQPAPATAPQEAPQPAAPMPDKGAWNAGARGAMQGFAFNLGDEIDALGEAGGFGKKQQSLLGGEYEDRSIVPLVRGFYNYMRGDPDTVKAYDEAVKRIRDEDKAAQEQHPVASTVGNIAGAVAVPLGGVLNAATLPARMGRGVAVGAGTGALYGAGEGENAADRVSRAAGGALVGGAIGGAAPAAIEGIIRGGRALAQPVATAARGVFRPGDEAARRVATAIQRDINIDPGATSRLTPQEFAASQQSGGPAAIMDLGGTTTRALARSAANTSPEGRHALEKTINDRFETQSGRVTDWLRSTFNYPSAEAQAEAIQQAARAANKAAYGKAFAQGRAGIWDNELSELSQAPVVKEAVAAATKQAQNKSAGGAINSQTNARWVNNGKPTLEFWDLVKRQIDQDINVAKRAGRNEDVKTLTEVKNALVSKLDDAVPTYPTARAGAAAAFGAEDALEAGAKFVTSNMTPAAARKALAQMSPQERQLFQDGFVSEFIGTLNKIGDRRSVLNKIAESPVAREKLNIALGPQKAAELEAGLRVEGIMDLARSAVQGTSMTARYLAEWGLAGGSGVSLYTGDPTAMMSAALVWGAARGKGKINENLARRVAEMLASNDPAILLRGIRTVTRNQQMFNSLRAVDQRLARIGGNQSPGVPALQAAGIGRAENDEPSVPRPPGQ